MSQYLLSPLNILFNGFSVWMRANSNGRRVAVVRNAKRVQPTETFGYTREADAETDQVFAPPQSRLQEHRQRGAPRGIDPHGTQFLPILRISSLYVRYTQARDFQEAKRELS